MTREERKLYYYYRRLTMDAKAMKSVIRVCLRADLSPEYKHAVHDMLEGRNFFPVRVLDNMDDSDPMCLPGLYIVYLPFRGPEEWHLATTRGTRCDVAEALNAENFAEWLEEKRQAEEAACAEAEKAAAACDTINDYAEIVGSYDAEKAAALYRLANTCYKMREIINYTVHAYGRAAVSECMEAARRVVGLA